MIDNKIFTFLELCVVMNYHKTAENLKMTQPAVTQHIKYLESHYGCKLFDYKNKKLTKTKKCLELEKHARSIVSLSILAAEKMSKPEKIKINIGATKTIGEYTIDDFLQKFLSNSKYEINIIIDNTEKLFERLNHFDLDVLMLEGYVDKEKYTIKKISEEEIVGICSKNHEFAFSEISIEDIFLEKAVFREKGSGTRAVFENFLLKKGYNIENFKNKSVISSNKLIEYAVCNDLAISFVYKVIPNKNKNLATFRIKNSKIFHEFNYVFLNKAKLDEIILLLN